ncbi:MAG: hypothetical protein LBP56_02035 [Odoribacteraceae bacterium]|jgi:hypothetical protein|nr:hypothetical protein [Odoribacteraceae bacterium]
MSLLTTDKIIKIFCIVADFYKEFSNELSKIPKLPRDGKKHRDRSHVMSESEMITILILYHFGSFKN